MKNTSNPDEDGIAASRNPSDASVKTGKTSSISRRESDAVDSLQLHNSPSGKELAQVAASASPEFAMVDTRFNVVEEDKTDSGKVATLLETDHSSNDQNGRKEDVVVTQHLPMAGSSILFSLTATGGASVATNTTCTKPDDHHESVSFTAKRATEMVWGRTPFFRRRRVHILLGTCLTVFCLGLIIPLTRKASSDRSKQEPFDVVSTPMSTPTSPPSTRPNSMPIEMFWEETGSIGLGADRIGVSLSADGSHLAVAESHWGGDSEQPGVVHVYNLLVRDSLDQVSSTLNSSTSGGGHQSTQTSNAKKGGWEQVGLTLNGSESGYRFRESVSLSGNGSRLAVGAIGSDEENQFPGLAGFIAMYDYDGSSWNLLGDHVAFSNYSDITQIILSSDGNWLAVACGDRKRIKLYQFSAGKWRKSGKFPGSTVALSLDRIRFVVAIGDPDVNDAQGEVKLYEYYEEWNGWNLTGTLSGKSDAKKLGYSMSVSATADRLAVGAPGGISSDTKQKTGLVRVFEYRKGSWIHTGDVAGEIGEEHFGRSVSLSGDGMRLTVAGQTAGANHIGRVRIYQLQPDAIHRWAQLGNAIMGSTVGDIVSMSADGNRLAMHSSNVSSAPPDSSYVHVFELRDSILEPPAVGSFSGCSRARSFQLILRTDLYGQEIKWELIKYLHNNNNKTVASGPLGGAFDSYKEYQFKRCLDRGCYRFVISDSGGDGICCTYGKGYFNVTFDGHTVASGGDFGARNESNVFCLGVPTSHVGADTQALARGMPWWLWILLVGLFGLLVITLLISRRRSFFPRHRSEASF